MQINTGGPIKQDAFYDTSELDYMMGNVSTPATAESSQLPSCSTKPSVEFSTKIDGVALNESDYCEMRDIENLMDDSTTSMRQNTPNPLLGESILH